MVGDVDGGRRGWWETWTVGDVDGGRRGLQRPDSQEPTGKSTVRGGCDERRVAARVDVQ